MIDSGFIVFRDAHASQRGQSNTDPQNPGEKGTREDGRKSILEVFIPVRPRLSISGSRLCIAGRAGGTVEKPERVKRS